MGGTVLAFSNDSVLFTSGLVLGVASVPVVFHIAVAMPSGRLRSEVERWTVGFTYAVFAAYSVVGWMFADNCLHPVVVPNCPRNLLMVVHDPALAESVDHAFGQLHALLSLMVVLLVVRRAVVGGRRTRIAVTPVLVAMVIQAWDLFTAFFNLLPGGPWSPEFWSGQVLGALVNGSLPVAFALGLTLSELAHRRVSALVRTLASPTGPADLEAVIARALGDPTATLAFVGPDGQAYLTADGIEMEPPRATSTRAVTMVERDEGPVAALVHDPALLEDPDLLEAVSAACGIALDNQRLTALLQAQVDELQASRARVVQAADTERRRIERDLHDGAQQRLLSVALELGRARERVSDEVDPRLRAHLEAASSQLDDAVQELRDLARGVHPPILTHHGLSAALEALSERTPLPLELVAPPAGRLPAPTEVAVYYLVAEGVVNAARHGEASHVTVRFSRDGGQLRVRVADDGRGGVDPARGSGLTGLRDRFEAVGGRLDIRSGPSGTCLTGLVPAGRP